MKSTRARLLTEGMRLFGEQGYAATSVAQIESATGLSPGSGSLYKHFRSKQELLAAGMEQLLGNRAMTDALAEPGSDDLVEALTAVARAGLRRMAEDRDVNRLLFRGLDSFPELLQRFGEGEIDRIHRATAAMLRGRACDRGASRDWSAIAVLLQGATAHYWLLADMFGEHPTGVDEDRFVAAVATVTAMLLTTGDE